MKRKMFDCRPWPGDCTVVISGECDEVVELQALHAVHAHGQHDTPELRSMIRAALTDSPTGA
ncbi:MAG: DUF1059 domain-containing protein [Chloroflexota bacterium]|nr:DUF1059 domain-containing protein [Chloroflexota bacterium]